MQPGENVMVFGNYISKLSNFRIKGEQILYNFGRNCWSIDPKRKSKETAYKTIITTNFTNTKKVEKKRKKNLKFWIKENV